MFKIILLSYLGILVAWTLINAILLLVSFSTKHKVFVASEIVTTIGSCLFGIAASIGDLMLVIWLFQNNYIFWGILSILVGTGIVSTIGSVLVVPFVTVVGLFSGWYDAVFEK